MLRQLTLISALALTSLATVAARAEAVKCYSVFNVETGRFETICVTSSSAAEQKGDRGEFPRRRCAPEVGCTSMAPAQVANISLRCEEDCGVPDNLVGGGSRAH